ncbi:hypothetical protein Bca52824_029971 [Brassica carinata]|uniref:Neprosin PEP catalytic domain-containing protein n=1 Tax=Brassica carinata TaxID=52824 RepID=A0A8X7V2S3_BRACI|nr:hypothetical protein Bca52824_029971 [Brassica carinata]
MRLILIFAILCGFYNETYGKVSLDIYKKLRTLNKPALKTIKMKRSVEFDAKTTSIPNNGSSKPITSQIWSKSRNCLVGTIPVGRVDITRASSLSHFGRKTHHRYSFSRQDFLDNALQHKASFNLTAGRLREPGSNNRIAIIVALGFNFVGAQSDINIWNPPGVQAGDYSSAQISLLGGISYSFEINEAGWMDPQSGNWWLTCGNNVMGYWPGTLFNALKHSATAVQWGGEVYSPNVMMTKPHTKTPMGSGNWASSLWSRACFHTNLRIKDFSLQIKYPQYLAEYVDEHNCYSTKLHRDTYRAEPRFYFGGPGHNPLCP